MKVFAVVLAALTQLVPFAVQAGPAAKSKLTSDQISQAFDAEKDFEFSDAGTSTSSFEQAVARLSKKLGTPKLGSGTLQEWWYDTGKNGKAFYCSTLALVPTPYGHAAFDKSMENTDDCAKIKRKSADVDPATSLETHDLAPVKQALAKLGAPQREKSIKTAAWTYQRDDDCMYVVYYEDNLKKDIWDLPCK